MTSKEQAVGPFGLSEVEGPSTSLGVNGPQSVLFVPSRGAASPHMTSKEQAAGPFGLSEVEGPSTSLGVNGPESVLFVRSGVEGSPSAGLRAGPRLHSG